MGWLLAKVSDVARARTPDLAAGDVHAELSLAAADELLSVVYFTVSIVRPFV